MLVTGDMDKVIVQYEKQWINELRWEGVYGKATQEHKHNREPANQWLGYDQNKSYGRPLL